MFDDIHWWKVIWWAVGTLGVAGTIALIVLYPVVLKAIATFFKLVLSYRIGCSLLAAVIAWFAADYIRHSIEDDKHAAEVAAFEQAQDARDARIRQETRVEVARELAAAKVDDAKTDKDVKDFTDALPKLEPSNNPVHAGNPFRVGDDAARLRQIAGQAERGPVGAQGVPKAHTGHESLRDRIRNRLPGVVRRSPGHDQQGQ